MKTKHNLLKNALRSGFAFALAFAVWLPGTAQGQDEARPMKPMNGAEHHKMDNPAKTSAKGDDMMDNCKAMMEKKQAMAEKMKTQDAQLSEQVAKMNSAPPDEKTGLMADVVTKLVQQRMARDEVKAKMEEAMMKHMMQHMKMGKESMAKCPMMKGMDEKSPDASDGEDAEKE